jgi:flavodoxin
MDPTRVLIVYYSRTGTTQQAALALREEIGCAVEVITDRTERTGVVGYLRSSLDALLGRTTPLAPMSAELASYDLVLVGTPVWNASVSAPVRSWLVANRGRIPRVAFFLTHGGWRGARAFRQMETICGKTPVATLALRADEVASGAFAQRVRSFARAVVAAEAERGGAAPAERLTPSPA